MHRESIGIELCNFGYITKGYFTKTIKGQRQKINLHPDKFYTYLGQEVNPNQLTETILPFRSHQHWQRYSEKQLKALKNLLEYQAYTHNIDICEGLPKLIRKIGNAAFDQHNIQQCQETPGLWSHSNVDKSKTDIAPQQELIDMLLSL